VAILLEDGAKARIVLMGDIDRRLQAAPTAAAFVGENQDIPEAHLPLHPRPPVDPIACHDSPPDSAKQACNAQQISDRIFDCEQKQIRFYINSSIRQETQCVAIGSVGLLRYIEQKVSIYVRISRRITFHRYQGDAAIAVKRKRPRIAFRWNTSR
jgi:hypothetical protein